MTMKRIVFTGGTGKAGRHVVPHLVGKGYDCESAWGPMPIGTVTN